MDNWFTDSSLCAQIAGQLNCCELQATTDGNLIIHDWVVVEHEPITCVPETPPAAMTNQDERILSNYQVMMNMVAVAVKQKVAKQKVKLTHVRVTKVKVIH